MEVVEMGLFGKKKKTVDLQQVFKDKYKDINQIVNDANNELDLEIQISLLELAYDKYNDLLDLIDQGVDFDKAHFLSMQHDLKKQIDLLKGL
jgi:predicted outer membrane protein